MGQGAPFRASSHVLFSPFSLKWSCIVQRPIQSGKDWGEGGGDRLSDTGVRPTTPCEIKIVLWRCLSSLCAPLYYNKNSHVLSYCCDPVVDEKYSYHAVEIKKKKKEKLHNCYKKCFGKCAGSTAEKGRSDLSFKACHCCSIIVHRGVCDCWIMALCILVWLYHQTEWVCALSPSSHEFLCGNRQLWWG